MRALFGTVVRSRVAQWGDQFAYAVYDVRNLLVEGVQHDARCALVTDLLQNGNTVPQGPKHVLGKQTNKKQTDGYEAITFTA